MGCRCLELSAAHVEVIFELQDIGLVMELVSRRCLRASRYDFEGFVLGGLEVV